MALAQVAKVAPITVIMIRILAAVTPEARTEIMAVAMAQDLAITAAPAATVAAVIMVPATDRAAQAALLITATMTATATETSTMKIAASLKKPLKGYAPGLAATNMTTETVEAASREAITVVMTMTAIN